jgi:hypothetical protein
LSSNAGSKAWQAQLEIQIKSISPKKVKRHFDSAFKLTAFEEKLDSRPFFELEKPQHSRYVLSVYETLRPVIDT